MHEFGTVEAKNRLSYLLDLVEQGEDVRIVRDGRPIARLIPAAPHADRAEAHAALARIRERAEQGRFGRFDWLEWKSYRDEGRP